MTNMEKHPHSTMIEATITTRGLIGMQFEAGLVRRAAALWELLAALAAPAPRKRD